MSAPAPPATVAVVIRTKNRPLLLARALESVLGQTYGDWVALVVNDAGDRDVVESAVAAVADRAQGRIHITHNEVSSGREAAMNDGVRQTSSTYLVLHDDDDSWAPSFLARTVAHLDDSEDGAVATRTEVVYERVDGDVVTTERRDVLAADKHNVTLLDMIVRNFTPPISVLYRRSVHDVVGEYDGTLPVLADWEFMLRLMSQFSVGFLDGEPLAFWHQRPDTAGDQGNSVVAQHDEHRRWDALVRDRFLRSDLARQGGLGYLLNVTETLSRVQIRTDRQNAHQVRLLEQLAQTVSDDVVRELHETNRHLVVQNNRLVAQLNALGERLEGLEELVWSQTPRARARAYRRAASHQVHRLLDRG